MDEAFESFTLRDITDRNHRMSLGGAGGDPRHDGVRLSTTGARRLPRSSTLRSSARSSPDLAGSIARSSSPEPFFASRGSHDPPTPAGRSPLGRPAGLAAPAAPAPPLAPVDSTRRSGPLLPPHLSSLDIPRRYGGNAIFDLYALVYVSEADVNLLCPICHEPLVDPVTTPCDHTFCYRCLRRSIASSPSGSICPIDREPLIWSHCFSAARLIRTQLNSLMVKCPYSARGCTLELWRESVEQHAKNECRFRFFTCPGANCSRPIRYKPTDDKCRHEEDNCMYCFAVIEDAEREFHLLSCPGSKTRCLTCWHLVCRENMEAHHSVECEGVEVSCHFQDYGCPVRVLRGDLDLHLLSCAFHPDTPSGAIIRTQRELIQSYGELGSQLRDIFVRQDEANGRLDEIVAAMAYRGMDSGGSGGGGVGGGSGDHGGGDGNRLDAGFEEVHQNLTQLEARQSMWTLNQVMPIREEVTELRNNINMIRMHVNWLLARSREEDRSRTAGNPPGSGATSSTMRPENPGRMPRVGFSDARRSSSMEFDVPRL